MPVSAYYFDGKTSRMREVTLAVEDGFAIISGDTQRRCPLADLHVSERLNNASRKITFPDGAYLEIRDTHAFNMLLRETGHEDSFVVRMQQSWRATLLAVLATATILAAGYIYGLPAFANAVAKALPKNAEQAISREALQFLDSRIFAPSELPASRQSAIVQRFKAIAPPQQDAPDYEIVFRKSRIGPNAFALPSGQIILTDEIVRLVDNDDAVMAILCHELGHLHERHLMRRVIQSSAIGAVATVLFGDVSSVIANVPTIMLDLKYSRDAEREADDYAIAMLKKNGSSVSALIHTFEKLGEISGDHTPYISTHPSAKERIERIRNAL